MEAPDTSTRLKMFAPMTLPRDREPWPLARDVMAVTSSGRLVPRATKVRAMTDSGTPRAWAIRVPLSTSRSAPTATRAAPMTSRRMSLTMEFFAAPSSTAPASSAAASAGFLKPCRTVTTRYTTKMASSRMPRGRPK